MKKILIIIIALSVCFAAFSQEVEHKKSTASNELRLNVLTTVALFPEITYERCFANDFGVGLSAAVALGGDIDVGNEVYTYQITPFFRFYFGSKPSSGFFIETNMSLIGLKYTYTIFYPSYYYSPGYSYSDNTAAFGLGFSVGYKYFNTRNLVGELYAGVGRTFGDMAYPRVGISLGVRL